MNKITMTLQVDHLILEALKEDISSEDVTTNSVMKEAVQLIGGRAKTECSGNVTKENIAKIRDVGVDYVSSGALTHSAPILDISLKNLHPLS